MSENNFAEVYCPKFHCTKINVLNVYGNCSGDKDEIVKFGTVRMSETLNKIENRSENCPQ